MLIKAKKNNSGKKLDKKLKEIKPIKLFNSKLHYGKLKWEEDPVEYQKNKRNEWD